MSCFRVVTESVDLVPWRHALKFQYLQELLNSNVQVRSTPTAKVDHASYDSSVRFELR
jgi:hypothetical protein